jgi:hypothetical protein
MVDFYSKTVLTAIAVALLIIAAQNMVPKANAQFGVSCGSHIDPCYIATTLYTPLEMKIVK